MTERAIIRCLIALIKRIPCANAAQAIDLYSIRFSRETLEEVPRDLSRWKADRSELLLIINLNYEASKLAALNRPESSSGRIAASRRIRKRIAPTCAARSEKLFSTDGKYCRLMLARSLKACSRGLPVAGREEPSSTRRGIISDDDHGEVDGIIDRPAGRAREIFLTVNGHESAFPRWELYRPGHSLSGTLERRGWFARIRSRITTLRHFRPGLLPSSLARADNGATRMRCDDDVSEAVV